MRIYELLNTHPPTRRYALRSDGIRIQQKPYQLGTPSPFGKGRGEAFFKGQSQGLLKRHNPISVDAVGGAYVDSTSPKTNVECSETGNRAGT